MRQVVFSPRAEAQLEAIYRYIVHQPGEQRAETFVTRLLAACRGLADFPERGAQRDDVAPGLRVMGYRRQATIAFTVEADRVLIQGVFGRGRDVERAFGIDDES